MAFFALFTTSRIKTVRAGERDCPQDNQALQASTDFRIETGWSIVFICCCAQYLFDPVLNNESLNAIFYFCKNIYVTVVCTSYLEI